MHDKEEQTEIDKLLGSLSTEEALLILEDLGENVKIWKMDYDFKTMIQNIINGLDEDNPNGITLYHGALEVIEEPTENYEIGDLG